MAFTQSCSHRYYPLAAVRDLYRLHLSVKNTHSQKLSSKFTKPFSLPCLIAYKILRSMGQKSRSSNLKKWSLNATQTKHNLPYNLQTCIYEASLLRYLLSGRIEHNTHSEKTQGKVTRSRDTACNRHTPK